MLTVRHLTKTFGRFTAVDDLSFEVRPGEAVALWGPNGAGKTTVIRCVLGLYRFRGSVEVNGHDARRAGRRARRSMGYVPQELTLYDDFRTIEAAHFFARLKRAPAGQATAVLRQVGLEAHARKRVRELSGGMKQRLALALALLADPPLLLLDELTANLDAAARRGFLDLLAGLRREGRTILFTSHRQEEVRVLADRALVLDSGRLVSDGPAAALAEKPAASCLLKVFVPAERVEQALGILRAQGFTATRNGSGVQVQVDAGAKAAPIRALARSDIEVRDFELGPDSTAPQAGDASHG